MIILASSTGYAILAAVGSAFVIVLGYIASILFRSGEFAAYARRMAFLDEKNVKMELSFANKTSRSKTYKNLGLAIKSKRGYERVSFLSHPPFVKGQDSLQVGHSLSLFVGKGEKATFVIDFHLSELSDAQYCLFCQVGKRGFVASIDLNSYKAKPIYFRPISNKAFSRLIG